ncbi:MAG: Zn-finger nucleic acid-binding protein [Myxococcota bacterium]|jgi:Zn-finger nucleic acid-binding protein
MAGVLVDRCTECTGVFFDAGELDSVLKLISVFNRVQLTEPELPVSQAERDRAVACPADGAAMEPVESGPVTIDKCPTCAGIWLDGGEIAALKLTENNIRENLNLYIRLGN